MYVYEIMSSIIITSISDSFVHPSRKLKKENGKPGHGERRLYIGCDPESTKKLATKPLLFDFSGYSIQPSYEIPPIPVHEQQGSDDGRRYYVGVKNLDDHYKKHWDEIRKSLKPQETCLEIKEENDLFVAHVKSMLDTERNTNSRGHSQIAVRWLEYEAKKNGIKIQHADNGGEFCLRTPKGYKWPVDGFCSETMTVYEFQGDYYHGNPSKFKSSDLFHGKPYSEKWAKDAAKRCHYESAGYKYVVMWESDWIEILKRLRSNV